MKVILISEIANLGKIGDVVEVKNGYARNFLIPNKKAICFTESNNTLFEEKRKQFEEENQKNIDSANKLKEAIFGKDVVIIESASDDGRLYGSVNSATIATKVNELASSSISRSEVFLAKPIKEIGIYNVSLAPHSEVNFSIRLIVTRSESEVDSLIKSEKEKSKAKQQREKEEKKAAEASEKNKVEEVKENENSSVEEVLSA